MKNWRRNAVLAGLPMVTAETATSQAVRTPWKAFWRRFRRQHIAMIAGAFILLLIAAAIFAPWLV
ncbi:glutathione ABC transporter permease GsiD, partial [Salmonella enterica subsp. enterica]